MASSVRLQVLELLEQSGELSVGQINCQIQLSQSALSQHLRILRDAKVVATRRDAQTIYYRLQDEDVAKILAALRTIEFD